MWVCAALGVPSSLSLPSRCQVSKLSRRVKLAEEQSRHLASLLEDGITERLATAHEELRQSSEAAHAVFRSQSEKVKKETMKHMNGMRTALAKKIEVTQKCEAASNSHVHSPNSPPHTQTGEA